jgi:hypothetical protein
MGNPIAVSDFAIDSLRWAARAGSIVSIGILLLFIIGEGFDPTRIAPKEWLGLLFFPLGVVAGMIVAWWREGLGGAITGASLLAFYLVYGLLLSGRFPSGGAFIVFAAPGFLFLTHWLLTRGAR